MSSLKDKFTEEELENLIKSYGELRRQHATLQYKFNKLKPEEKTIDMITIEVRRFEELIQGYAKLNALEACGVDNWQGYDDAMGLMRETVEE